MPDFNAVHKANLPVNAFYKHKVGCSKSLISTLYISSYRPGQKLFVSVYLKTSTYAEHKMVNIELMSCQYDIYYNIICRV